MAERRSANDDSWAITEEDVIDCTFQNGCRSRRVALPGAQLILK